MLRDALKKVLEERRLDPSEEMAHEKNDVTWFVPSKSR